MKVTTSKEKPGFQPFSITLSVESQEEVDAIKAYAEQHYTAAAYVARYARERSESYTQASTPVLSAINSAIGRALVSAGHNPKGY